MQRTIICIMAIICAVPVALASWTFTDVNIGGDTAPSILNSAITWRPQGDYALVAADDGLYRYNYPEQTLEWDPHGTDTLTRAVWSNDGSYAIITGGTHIYRYEHAASGFGALTEITDIEGDGTYTTTFYDACFNPADDDDPPYIAANRQIGSNKQIIIYRYDPGASPQVYWDYAGGQSPVAGSSSSSYAPVCTEFQADGDYIVICNSFGSYIQGYFVYDPDQSTFIATGGVMPFYSVTMGNARTASMSPVSGDRVMLIKGTGTVHAFQQTYPPGDWTEIDTGAAWHTSISEGGSDFSWDGSRVIFTERQSWDPHMVMVFNGAGNFLQHLTIESPGFTNVSGVRIYDVAWHPSLPVGLMAGGHRWIFQFETTEVPAPVSSPTPQPTATAEPTATVTAVPTPSPEDIPATTPVGIILALIALSLIVTTATRRKRLQ